MKFVANHSTEKLVVANLPIKLAIHCKRLVDSGFDYDFEFGIALEKLFGNFKNIFVMFCWLLEFDDFAVGGEFGFVIKFNQQRL